MSLTQDFIDELLQEYPHCDTIVAMKSTGSFNAKTRKMEDSNDLLIRIYSKQNPQQAQYILSFERAVAEIKLSKNPETRKIILCPNKFP